MKKSYKALIVFRILNKMILMRFLLIICIFVPTANAQAAPESLDLATRQGRFINLINVLSLSNQLDNPKKVAYLLSTKFEIDSINRVSSTIEKCSGAPNEIFNISVTPYIPVEHFWFTDRGEVSEQKSSLFSYVTTLYTPCTGSPYHKVDILFDGLDNFLCLSEAEMRSSEGEKLQTINSSAGQAYRLYFDGFASAKEGNRVFISWSRIISNHTDEHKSCASRIEVIEDKAFNTNNVLKQKETNNRNFIGVGNGYPGATGNKK